MQIDECVVSGIFVISSLKHLGTELSVVRLKIVGTDCLLNSYFCLSTTIISVDTSLNTIRATKKVTLSSSERDVAD